MGVIRTILIIVLVYYAFRFIAKLAMPFLLRTFVNKAQQNMQDQFNRQYQSQKQRPEGEVNIDRGAPKKQHKTDSLDAEDVDFEEID